MPLAILKNAVERVVDALHKQQPELRIPASVVRAASEQYRLLETRVRVGSIRIVAAGKAAGTTAADSAERRAAVLLEYCARTMKLCSNSNSNSANQPDQQQQRLVLSWPVVGAAVHVKKTASLQQLQHVILNFLQPDTAAAATTSSRQKQQLASAAAAANRRGAASSSEANGRSLRHRNHTVNYKDGCAVVGGTAAAAAAATSSSSSRSMQTRCNYVPKILPELVIRLVGHLVDPHGTQKLAVQLLQDIHAYYDTPVAGSGSGGSAAAATMSHVCATERRGHLYDLQRYAAAYEAAALLHVATTAGNNNVGGSVLNAANTTKRGKRQIKKNGKSNKDEALNADDEDGERAEEGEVQQQQQEQPIRGLQLSDLMEASTEFTYLEVKQVLPRVQELAKKISGLDQLRTGNAKRKAAAETSHPRKRQPLQLADPGQPRQKQTLKNGLVLKNFVDVDSIAASGLATNSSPRRNGVACDDRGVPAAPSFSEWKSRILSAARDQARDELLRRGSDSLGESPTAGTQLSDRDAMAMAADAVLQTYGLLPSSTVSSPRKDSADKRRTRPRF